MDVAGVSIKRFTDVSEQERPGVLKDLDRIFFDASLKREFATSDERSEFRDRWMGQYITQFPDLFLVATLEASAVGYLAGYIPLSGREHDFSNQHHVSVFEDLWGDYPAHLHINVDQCVRSQGVGGQLIDGFLSMCRASSVAGAHIVTGDGSRNNAFYRKVGLTDEVRRSSEGRDMLFMGRRL